MIKYLKFSMEQSLAVSMEPFLMESFTNELTWKADGVVLEYII